MINWAQSGDSDFGSTFIDWSEGECWNTRGYSGTTVGGVFASSKVLPEIGEGKVSLI